MPESSDPHVQEVMDEAKSLREQHGVAAERVSEAEEQLTRAQQGLDTAREADPRGGGTAATAAGEQEVYVKEAQVDREKERLETHLKMTGMAADENLDVLITEGKKEMDADLASRDAETKES